MSVQDFEDFAETYAGIGKASDSLLQGTITSRSPRWLLIPRTKITRYIGTCSRRSPSLVIRREVRVSRSRSFADDHHGESEDRSESAMGESAAQDSRKALLQRFHSDRCDLGQDLLLSDAVATIQKVDGVLYVDVDKFDAVRNRTEVARHPIRMPAIVGRASGWIWLDSLQKKWSWMSLSCRSMPNRLATRHKPPRLRGGKGIIRSQRKPSGFKCFNRSDQNVATIRAAQICYLTPDIPDTLILEPIR